MTGYTPTTEEVREAISEWAWARRMFRPELGQSDGLEADRWLAAHDAEVRAGVVAEEPEWEVDSIQYGHLLAEGVFMVEAKGKNYATHQRRIKLGRPTWAWVPVKQEGAETDV